MDRQEFLGGLERTLRGGGISEALIWDHMNYYGSYFDSEAAKGRTEEEIAEDLGDPRLIAKTILETQGEDIYRETAGTYESEQETYGSSEGRDRGFHAELGENGWDVRVGKFKINSWYGYLLIGLIVCAVLSLVISIIGGIVSFVAPAVLPVLVIVLILRFFSRRR